MAVILYICAAYPHARGVKWVSALRDAEFSVVVFRGGNQKGAATIWADNADVIAVRTVNGLDTKFSFDAAICHHIVRQAAFYEPDAILVRDIFLAGYALCAAKKLDIPCYVDLAENYPEVAKSIIGLRLGKNLGFYVLNQWEQYVLRRASGVVAVSPESKTHIMSKHGLHDSQVFVVENVPKDLKARLVSSSVFSGNLVYIGTYDRGIRDLDTVIEGLKQYHRTARESMHLTIYAFQPERLRSLLHEHGNPTEFVTVMPAVENSTLHETLCEFDVGVVPHCRCPATEYTVPNKLYDYLYSGLRVICSDNPPFRRILKDIGGGIVYSAGDPLDFAESLRCLKVMIEERTAQINAGRLTSKYDWNVQVESFVRHLHNTLT